MSVYLNILPKPKQTREVAFSGRLASKQEAPLHFTVSSILKHLETCKYEEFGVTFYVTLDAYIEIFIRQFLETVKRKQ